LTNEIICSLSNVIKTYRDTPIINRFNLQVNKGETVALVGASGSGKSTLLNMIGILEKQDSGIINLFGKSAPRIGSLEAQKILRYRIGYLFQNSALIDNETVEYNLKIAQTYTKSPTKNKQAERKTVLEKVGLSGFEKRSIYELSGGEQQGLAIARLLIKPCELILADEPTGSLDPGNRDIVLALLQELHNLGKTIIVVTHDSVVAEHADRVIRLDASRMSSF